MSQRILCIEDNPMNWRLVQRLLTHAGFEMHWASEGLRGYDLALELRPALILLDINLPGLSGFEIATKLRQSRDLDGTIIVALTAKTMTVDRDTALVTGCDGFISKPIDPFRFVDQVKSYLEGRRDRIEEGREGETLRQFSQQVVEHIEGQLRELQESNKKLIEAQGGLEIRNRQLSSLLELSQSLVVLHDPREILQKVMERLATDLGLLRLTSYLTHESGGYLEGLAWSREGFKDLPVLAGDHPLLKRLAGQGSLLRGEALQNSAAFDEGVALGLWGHRDAPALLSLHVRSKEGELRGMLALARDGADPVQPYEAELAALCGGILQVSLENAALISHLNETSRALGQSFERLEGAYQDLQQAQQALGQRERKALFGDLFHKIAQRLQAPVTSLRFQSQSLEALLPALGAAESQKEEREKAVRALDAIHGSMAQMDGLVRALLRRAGQEEPTTPEWINLHDLVYQELELMQAEGTLPEGVQLRMDLQARHPRLYGVYSDFAEVLGHLVANGLAGALAGGPEAWLEIRTRGNGDGLSLEVRDGGEGIPAEFIDGAFQPFSGLRPSEAKGRRPGQGLAASAQLMSAYGGRMRLESQPGATSVTLELPKEPEEEARSGS